MKGHTHWSGKKYNNKIAHLSKDLCDNCGGAIKSNACSSSCRYLCGKCYLKWKKEERKRMGRL